MPLSSMPTTTHIPVLAKEIIAQAMTDETVTVYDGTLGLGGHAELLLTTFPNVKTYIGTDLDQVHLDRATARLAPFEGRFTGLQGNFSEHLHVLADAEKPCVVLLDLGICSAHIDEAERGFSFRENGPLDMAFSHTADVTAKSLLNEAEPAELKRILREYGEDPYARIIVQELTQSREEKPFETTNDLVEALNRVTPPHNQKKTHMRVFQALRIAVNDELGHLERTLATLRKTLTKGDRVAIITYHSLEDRIVKKAFKAWSTPPTKATELSLHTPTGPAWGRLLTKKPILPTDEEIAENQRARSAKLRIVECVNEGEEPSEKTY